MVLIQAPKEAGIKSYTFLSMLASTKLLEQEGGPESETELPVNRLAL